MVLMGFDFQHHIDLPHPVHPYEDTSALGMAAASLPAGNTGEAYHCLLPVSQGCYSWGAGKGFMAETSL